MAKRQKGKRAMIFRQIVSYIQNRDRSILGATLYIFLFFTTSILFIISAMLDKGISSSHILIFAVVNAILWLGGPSIRKRLKSKLLILYFMGGYILIAHFSLVFTGGHSSYFYYLYYPLLFAVALNYGFRGTIVVSAIIAFLYASLFWGGPMDVYVKRIAQLCIAALMLGFISAEKRKTERQLEDYAELLMNSIGSGIILTDAEGRITSINEAAEEILGYKAGELQGQLLDVDIMLHPPNESPVLIALEENKQVDRIDTFITTKSGAKIPAGGSVYPLRDNRRMLGVVEIFRDLSEIKEREEQVNRQKRLVALGKMAAEVAHEVKNPLGGIKGFTSLLARNIEDEKAQRYVNFISEGISNLEKVVNDFLIYARLVVPSFQKIEIHELIENCLTLTLECVNGTKVNREFADNIKVDLDPAQMKQVLMNLILNAVEAMPNGGTLTVSTSLIDANYQHKSTGEFETCPCVDKLLLGTIAPHLSVGRGEAVVQISIADTGEGIPPENKEKIFNPFFTTKDTGTGLGLAVVHRIIQAHNGSIFPQDAKEGGTIFVIELPLVQTQTFAGRKEGGRQKSEGLNVLLPTS